MIEIDGWWFGNDEQWLSMTSNGWKWWKSDWKCWMLNENDEECLDMMNNDWEWWVMIKDDEQWLEINGDWK